MSITTCVNSEWKTGLASSLKLGVKTLRNLQEVDAVLISVADQPGVTAEDLKRLTDSFLSGRRLVAASYGNVLGVPCIFGREYFDELEKLAGDEGAGKWLRSRANEVATISIPEAALDIDTAKDLARLNAERP